MPIFKKIPGNDPGCAQLVLHSFKTHFPSPTDAVQMHPIVSGALEWSCLLLKFPSLPPPGRQGSRSTATKSDITCDEEQHWAAGLIPEVPVAALSQRRDAASDQNRKGRTAPPAALCG